MLSPQLVDGCRGPCPDADPLGDLGIPPVAHHGGPAEPKAALEVAEFAVSVGRLVEVHEVHVDLRPREIAVVLRVEMEQGLLE
jgi:hypothetical protein